VYGAVIALKVSILILAATVASACVDPDELLRGVRRLSFRAALTATLAIRMVPLLAADAQRLAEAQRTRPGAGAVTARARLALVTALLGGALDRALDVAATLEVRGLATARRPPRARRPWSRHDIAFTCAAFTLVGVAIAGAAQVSFAAYPLVHMQLGAAGAALCAGLLASMLLPFCDRRGVQP
jgi:energy-coupling factor transport system permease protein